MAIGHGASDAREREENSGLAHGPAWRIRISKLDAIRPLALMFEPSLGIHRVGADEPAACGDVGRIAAFAPLPIEHHPIDVRRNQPSHKAWQRDAVCARCATHLAQRLGQLGARVHASGELKDLAIVLGRAAEDVGGRLADVDGGGDVLDWRVHWSEHLDPALCKRVEIGRVVQVFKEGARAQDRPLLEGCCEMLLDARLRKKVAHCRQSLVCVTDRRVDHKDGGVYRLDCVDHVVSMHGLDICLLLSCDPEVGDKENLRRFAGAQCRLQRRLVCEVTGKNGDALCLQGCSSTRVGLSRERVHFEAAFR
mmetsp:Transcript_15686/g.31707  ORF Transcript_15686/g.31707 Transcript_15686/m.31707 type:complete len:309 (-) Transcript_15686:87-1013(-)